jgi:hypothetical protein
LADLFPDGHRARSLSILFIGEARSYQYLKHEAGFHVPVIML